MSRYKTNPGELRHKVEIVNEKRSTNPYTQTNTVEVVKVARVAIYPVKGSELQQSEIKGFEVTHKINMRYAPGIKAGQKVLFKDRKFSIVEVINFQERNVTLQLLCKEVI